MPCRNSFVVINKSQESVVLLGIGASNKADYILERTLYPFDTEGIAYSMHELPNDCTLQFNPLPSPSTPNPHGFHATLIPVLQIGRDATQ